ncbi:hypothetical protein D3C87_1801970 [compost metagenome]
MRHSVGLGVLRASESVHQPFDAQIVTHRRHVGSGKLAEIVQRDGFQESRLQIGQLAAQFLDYAGLRYSLETSGLGLGLGSALFSLIIWRACFR